MAKAKKQEATESTTKKKTPAAKKTSKPATAHASGTPTIDTSLAAQSVAAMMSNRAAMGAPPVPARAADAPKSAESSTFKQMKEGLNKPSSQVMGNLLGNVQGKKKS